MDKSLERTAQITAEIARRQGITEAKIPTEPKKLILWNIQILQNELNRIDATLRRMADDD
jgi:hypothetical protein